MSVAGTLLFESYICSINSATNKVILHAGLTDMADA
jgi:hypothetical protein